jgi:hypothetical protein
MSDQLPTEIIPATRLLTAAEFHRLADVPPESEWFANIRNRSTRRAYENAIRDFMRFTGIVRPDKFRTVTRADVIAWRDDPARRDLGGATIRHRHAALSSLFEYLCKKNAVSHHPVKGVKRPKAERGEGKRRRSTIIRRASCSPRPNGFGHPHQRGRPGRGRSARSGRLLRLLRRLGRQALRAQHRWRGHAGHLYLVPAEAALFAAELLSGAFQLSPPARRGSSSWSAIRTARSPSRGPGADLDPS